jgi:hypothetical protein
MLGAGFGVGRGSTEAVPEDADQNVAGIDFQQRVDVTLRT